MKSTIPYSFLAFLASVFLFFGFFLTFPKAIEDVPFDYDLIYESNDTEFHSDVTIVDTDSDGEKEVYTLIHGGREVANTALLKLDNKGNEVFKIELSNFIQVYGKPVIGDFIEGDNLEIAILTRGFGNSLYVKFYNSTDGVFMGEVEIPGNEGLVLGSDYDNILNVVKVAFGKEKLVLGYQPEVGNSQILLIGFDGIEAVELLINRDLTVNPFLMDFNNDGFQDIVYGWSYTPDSDSEQCQDSCLGLSVLDVSNGNIDELENIRTDLDSVIYDVAVGNVDEDEFLEIVFLSDYEDNLGVGILSKREDGVLIKKRTGFFDQDEILNDSNARVSLVDSNNDGINEIMISASSKLYDYKRDIVLESNIDFDIPFVNPAETLSIDFDNDGLQEFIGAFRTCGAIIYDDFAKFNVLDFESNDCIVRGMTLTSLEQGKTHLVAWYSPAPTEETFRIKIFEISPSLPDSLENSWLMNNHDNCNSSNLNLLDGCDAQSEYEPGPVDVTGDYLFEDLVSLQVRNFDLDNDSGLEFAAVVEIENEYIFQVKDQIGNIIMEKNITEYIPDLETDLITAREVNVYTGNFDDDENLEFVVTNMVYYPSLVTINRPDEYTNFLVFDDEGSLLFQDTVVTTQFNLDSEYAIADFNFDGVKEIIVAHTRFDNSAGGDFLQVSHFSNGVRKDSASNRVESDKLAGVTIADLQGNGGLEFLVGYYRYNFSLRQMEYTINGYIVEDIIYQPIFKGLFHKEIGNSLAFDMVSGDVDNQLGDELVTTVTGIKDGYRVEYIQIYKWRQELSNVDLFTETSRVFTPSNPGAFFMYGVTSLVDLNQDNKLEILNPKEKLAYDYVNDSYIGLIEEDGFANQFRSSMNTAKFEGMDSPVSFISSLSPICNAYFVEDGSVFNQKKFDKDSNCSIENVDLIQSKDSGLILGVQSAIPGESGINYQIYMEEGLFFEESENVWLTRDHDNCGTYNYSSTQNCNNVELGTGVTPTPTPSPTSIPTPTPTPPPVENPNHFVNVCTVFSNDGEILDARDIPDLVPELRLELFENAYPNSSPFGEDPTEISLTSISYDLNTDSMFNDGLNDAFCQIVEFEGDNPTYYRYAEVETEFEVEYTDKNRPSFGYEFSEFDTYDSNLFDGNPDNNNLRRKAQDGNMWFGEDGTTRNLMINIEINVPTYHELEVCSIVKNTEGKILDEIVDTGSEFGGSLFENVRVNSGAFGENEQQFEVGISNYELNSDITNSDGVNDAFCQSFEYIDEGNEFYRYTYSNPQFGDVKVNDIANQDNGYENVSFFDFDNSLYDTNPDNDDARNTASDGHVWLGNNNTKRRIVLEAIVTEVDSPPEPVIIDLQKFDVADIDNDGELNYVGQYTKENGDNYFTILDSDLNILCTSDPISGVNYTSDVVTGNFDFDDKLESAYMAEHYVYVFSHECEIASGWPRFVYQHWIPGQDLIKHDVNNDGIDDLISIGWDYAKKEYRIIAHNGYNGAFIVGRILDSGNARIYLGDFNGDSVKELLIVSNFDTVGGNRVYEIVDFDNRLLNVSAFPSPNRTIVHSILVDDIDDDGKDEIVAVESEDNSYQPLDIWEYSYSNDFVGRSDVLRSRIDATFSEFDIKRFDSMLSMDIEEDNDNEVVLTVESELGVVIQMYFDTEEAFWSNNTMYASISNTGIFEGYEMFKKDLDSDGKSEVIFMGPQTLGGTCSIVIVEGRELDAHEKLIDNPGVECSNLDTQIYVNNDGNYEIAFITSNGNIEIEELMFW